MRKSNLIVFTFLFLIFSATCVAEGNIKKNQDTESLELNRFHFFFENDLFSTTDSQYSSGVKLNLLYRVENPKNPLYELLYLDYDEYEIYTSFSVVNQIYTPADLSNPNLIIEDRPYAGWTYLEYGVHKSSKKDLRSLYLQIGMIGPASKSEQIQKTIHNITGSSDPMGWDNQLQNELGINLTYIHKWRFAPEPLGGFERAIIPFLQGELGNISTKAVAGISTRIGWNILKDFGVSTVDAGGEVGVCVLDESQGMLNRDWSFSFNLLGYGSAIAHDIFLDGNTFKQSHSVDKNNFVAYLGFGFTARYQKFVLNFMQTKSTSKFKEEKGIHTVGTVVISWLY